MYGQPMNPTRCEFEISTDDGMLSEVGDIVLVIGDLDEPDNDDIRDVIHADFDRLWDNACENVFTSDKFKTEEEARKWCLSIGMKEANESLGLGG